METADEFIARMSARWEATRHIPLRFKDIGREGEQLWYRDAWTMRVESGYPYKVLVLERLRRGEFVGQRHFPQAVRIGDPYYRLGYYTVGAIGRTKGTWRWGQFAQLIPAGDFALLLEEARSKGTLLDA
jgi:hypothetical protein